jgi:hypothetical protein
MNRSGARGLTSAYDVSRHVDWTPCAPGKGPHVPGLFLRVQDPLLHYGAGERRPIAKGGSSVLPGVCEKEAVGEVEERDRIALVSEEVKRFDDKQGVPPA